MSQLELKAKSRKLLVLSAKKGGIEAIKRRKKVKPCQGQGNVWVSRLISH